MRTWLYDGSFEGLLTTLAILFENGEAPGALEVGLDSLPLFGPAERVVTDEKKAVAFLEFVRKQVSTDVVRHIVRVGMADRLSVGLPVYRFLRLALEHGSTVVSYHAHPDVRAVYEISAAVGREIHRLKGLLRFRETEDGWLWGPIAPDHNVTAAVAQHFRFRMPAERWVIHDVVRRIAIAWDGHDWVEREHLDPRSIRLSAREKEVQEWWRIFYREIAIGNRTNARLQAQNMPRRYWMYLIEEPTASRPRRVRSHQ